MTSSRLHVQTAPESVTFDDTTMHVTLRNGDRVSTPLSRFPRLLHGTAEQRSHWRVIGAGDGINWPLLDEDISIKGLFAEKREAAPPSRNIHEIFSIIGTIHAESAKLCRISGRDFILDGLFVATTGRVVAEYIYGLTDIEHDSHVLRTRDGRTVKVALTMRNAGFAVRWTEAAKRDHADILLCLQLDEDGFQEIYNGRFPIELLRDRSVSANGQVKLSIRSLAELNPALLDKEHSLASINVLLRTKLANAA